MVVWGQMGSLELEYPVEFFLSQEFLSIWMTENIHHADLLGFSHTAIQPTSLHRRRSRKEKPSSEQQLCGWKRLVDVRGRLVGDKRQATVTHIMCVITKEWKKMCYSSRGPRPSAQNSEPGPQLAQARQNWKIQNSAWVLVTSLFMHHRPWSVFALLLSVCLFQWLRKGFPGLLVTAWVSLIQSVAGCWAETLAFKRCAFSPVGHFLSVSRCRFIRICFPMLGKGREQAKVECGGARLPNTRLYQEAFLRLI